MATGEVWFGADALEKGLVDELQTSSEYILQQIREGHEVLEVSYKQKAGALSGLGVGALASLTQEALKSERWPSWPSWLGGFGGTFGSPFGSSSDAVTAATALSALLGDEVGRELGRPRVETPDAAWKAQARLDRSLPEL